MTRDIVRVGLGARSYDITIGDHLLESAGDVLKPVLNRAYTVIVTDENVMAAQGERLAKGLESASIKHDFIVLSPGEKTKSFAELEALTARLLDLSVERNDTVLALGGGVIGDLTGFACSVLRRGCRFVQVPTSLLAQVDSSVGGKTAINVPQGKNLIGAFYQPTAVISDIAVLDTLPVRDLRAGYAEIVKYGLINDRDFFAWLEEHGPALLGGDKNLRRHAVKVSCEAKARIVANDERERGERALLNLGHTFGHALEGAYGFSDKLLHGEAVALGIVLAFQFSAAQGHCPPEDAARVAAHFKASGLPTRLADLPPGDALNPDHLMNLMMQDKKVEAGALTLILASKIGGAFIEKNASVKEVAAFWAASLS